MKVPSFSETVFPLLVVITLLGGGVILFGQQWEAHVMSRHSLKNKQRGSSVAVGSGAQATTNSTTVAMPTVAHSGDLAVGIAPSAVMPASAPSHASTPGNVPMPRVMSAPRN